MESRNETSDVDLGSGLETPSVKLVQMDRVPIRPWICTWTWSFLCVLIVFVSMPTSVKAEEDNRHVLIIGIGVAGLVLLTGIWIFVCFCLNWCCFDKDDDDENEVYDQGQDKNGYQQQRPQQQQHQYGEYPQRRGTPLYSQNLEPWTVLEYQEDNYGYSNYAYDQSVSPAYQEHIFGSGSAIPQELQGHPHTAPYLVALNPGPGVAIPKPDYYYDNKDVSTTPVDVPPPSYARQYNLQQQQSQLNPQVGFKLKPVPPPKPMKSAIIPLPDY